MSPWSNVGPDIVVIDDEGRPTIFIEIKERVDPGDRPFFLKQLRDYADAAKVPHRYLIMVEQDTINIYGDADQPLLTLPSTTLDDYDKRGNERAQRRYESLLRSLTAAWLRDFRNRVVHNVPPGSDKLPQELLDMLYSGEVVE